jgi:hypothetical protein
MSKKRKEREPSTKTQLDRLKVTIVCNSTSDEWEEARREWSFVGFWVNPTNAWSEDVHCVCGQCLVEGHVLGNPSTGAQFVIGNICVTQFECTDVPVPRRVVESLHRVQKNPEHVIATPELLALAQRFDFVEPEEVRTYVSITRGKGSRKRFSRGHRCFSRKLFQTRRKTNLKLVDGFSAHIPAKRPRKRWKEDSGKGGKKESGATLSI